MVMGTGAGSTVSFRESPTQLTPGEFRHAKSQHREEEFLLLGRVLEYKRREREAACAALTFMASFSTDELGWGCGEVILFQQDGESLGRRALGLGPVSSITSLEMKNLAVICSDCNGAEKLLTPLIHRRSFYFCAPSQDWRRVFGESERGGVRGLFSSSSGAGTAASRGACLGRLKKN